MARLKKSEKLIRAVKKALDLHARTGEGLYCFRMEEIGTPYTLEEKQAMDTLSNDHWAMRKRLKEVFAAKVGKAIMDEL